MPSIYTYTCSHCLFALPSGWGGGSYVLDDDGAMVPCPHPGEYSRMARVLGIPVEKVDFGMYLVLMNKHPRWWWLPERTRLFELLTARTGQYSWCVCEGCLAPFRLDIERSPRECPECHGAAISTIWEAVDGPCPKCRSGIIAARDTGAIA